MTEARDIMSALERVGAQDTVATAVQTMADLHVDALPICGPAGALQTMQGMITEDDVQDQVVAHGLDPATTRVGELPQTDTATIGAGESIEDALETMSANHIDRLPVIEGPRIVGVLDQSAVEDAVAGSG